MRYWYTSFYTKFKCIIKYIVRFSEKLLLYSIILLVRLNQTKDSELRIDYFELHI